MILLIIFSCGEIIRIQSITPIHAMGVREATKGANNAEKHCGKDKENLK